MIDRDPIELGSEVFLHLPDHVAGEAAKIGQPVAVLGRHDEAELMPVLSPAFEKLAAIHRVSLRSIEPASLSFPVRPVALQITQMRVGALAPESQPDDPRLDDDAAHSLARASLLGGALQPIGRHLSPTDAATSPFSGPAPRAATWTAPLSAHWRRCQRTALRLRHGLHHLSNERARSPRWRTTAIADFSGAESKVGRVVVAHPQKVAPASAQNKLKFE